MTAAGLEQALDETVATLSDAVKSADSLVKELKKARTAANAGQVRDLTRTLAVIAELSTQVAADSARAGTSYDFDDARHLASGGYTKELLATAAERGVTMVEEDDQLLCYPSLVRVFASDAAIEIDRKRERRLRPSVVVDLLAKNQERPGKLKPGPFLHSLAAAYDLVLGRERKQSGAVVRLDAIWSVLTLLPGQSREYTKPEFARDLYQLDLSKQLTTSTGRKLRWHASTGTRGTGVLTTVARTGQQQRYWGISFSEPGDR